MNSRFLLAVLPVTLFACTQPEGDAGRPSLEPPVAKIEPHNVTDYGHTRIDDYHWLGDRENPEVIAYLEAENAYTEAVMASTQSLQQTLFEEIQGRTKETDLSVPTRVGDYVYYTRWEEGKEYPIYARKLRSLEASEEVLIDVDDLAPAQGFFDIPQPKISPGQDLLAFFSISDARGGGSIRIKNLDTGQMLEDEVPEVSANIEWGSDNRTLFYIKVHPEARSWNNRVYRHILGADPAEDTLVYEETDDRVNLRLGKTTSQQYVIILDTRFEQARYLEADNPTGRFKLFLPRAEGHNYRIDHLGEHFYISTNDAGENGRLVRTPVDYTGRDNWEEVIPHRDDVQLLWFQVFKDYLVLEERKSGLRQIRIRPWSGEAEHVIDFGEPTYLAYFAPMNQEFESETLRYGYSSLTTPLSVYEYNMKTREKVLRKRDEVLGDFDPDGYVSERLYAPARDGTQIPVSIVYREGTEKDGSHPLLLYVYGGYGVTVEASFDAPRLSLLDRGFIHAIAHVRGGGALGPGWEEEGTGLKKKNTFTDYIDVAEYLVAQRYTNPDRLFAEGGSGGGLVMGVVANMRPDLFEGIVADVPLVDVLGWADSLDEEHHRYTLSYSPYDNVEARAYPNMLVSTALDDSRVPYSQSAKWIAKLRAFKTDSNLLLLRTNMEAGHTGTRRRYDRWRDIAFQYAFLLHLAGIHE